MNHPNGKVYELKLVPSPNCCTGCAFDRDPSGCLDAGNCYVAEDNGMAGIFVLAEEDDFLSGVQACDLSGEGTCEACQ